MSTFEPAETLGLLARGARLDRRRLLGTGLMAAGVVAVTPLLAACGGSDDPTAAAPAATAAGGVATPTIDSSAARSPTAGMSAATAATGSSPTTAATAVRPTTAAPTATAGTQETGVGGQLIVVRQNDSDSLDPQRTVLGASYFVFSNIFDCLITTNASNEFDPIVAEKYEIAQDCVTITWTIRQGMTFHDGSAVTADDVKYTYDRATDANNPAQAASFISAYKSAELVGDKTVKMTLWDHRLHS